MDKLTRGILRHKRLVWMVFAALTFGSLLLLPLVRVNYDLTAYLPEDMPTSRAYKVMEQEFGATGMARVMAEGIDLPAARAMKTQIAAVEGVKTVLWLDDVADIRQPLEMLGEETTAPYYQDGAALFTVEFTQDSYSETTARALKEIEKITGGSGTMDGPAVDTAAMQETTKSQVFLIAAFVIPAFLLILLLTTTSWLEPLLYIAVIGISVLINMGTNVVFRDISFITQMTAAVLQFAVSIDYSLFLMHRFTEERQQGATLEDALSIAMRRSFSSLSASCLTTVAGFVALVFMRYRIGMDMGLVLVKGILISLASVLILMPALILATAKLLERTKHRPFLPSFRRLGRGVVKLRGLILPLAVVVLVPMFLAQRSNDFLYGETSLLATADGLTDGQKRMNERFGIYNPVVVLVPGGDTAAENALTAALKEKPYILQVQSIAALADPALPRDWLPGQLTGQFQSEHYQRMILNLAMKEETSQLFAIVDDL